MSLVAPDLDEPRVWVVESFFFGKWTEVLDDDRDKRVLATVDHIRYFTQQEALDYAQLEGILGHLTRMRNVRTGALVHFV